MKNRSLKILGMIGLCWGVLSVNASTNGNANGGWDKEWGALPSKWTGINWKGNKTDYKGEWTRLGQRMHIQLFSWMNLWDRQLRRGIDLNNPWNEVLIKNLRCRLHVLSIEWDEWLQNDGALLNANEFRNLWGKWYKGVRWYLNRDLVPLPISW